MAIYGLAGGGLADGRSESWARNAGVARAGESGEVRTARLLGELLPDDVAVLHDVRIPIKRMRGINVDHVVVSGRDVWLLDSKSWRPGRYVTFRGRTYRGWSRFEPADHKTMQVASRRFSTVIPSATIRGCLVVVHPSSPGRVNLRWYRPVAATAVTDRGLRRFLAQIRDHHDRADETVVGNLVPLLTAEGR